VCPAYYPGTSSQIVGITESCGGGGGVCGVEGCVGGSCWRVLVVVGVVGVVLYSWWW